MNEDAGIGSLVSRLHKRLDEARESARKDLPGVEELMARQERRGRDDAPESVSRAESKQETKDGSQRRAATTSAKRDISGGKEAPAWAAEEDPGSRRCRECGKRYHADVPDEEHPKLCEECNVRKAEVPPPVTGWRPKSLGRLNEAILGVLYDAYPEELTAREIADRLSARNVAPEEADKSDVNSKLYGPLFRWLNKKEETPPLWGLQPAKGSREEGASSHYEGQDSPHLSSRSHGSARENRQDTSGAQVVTTDEPPQDEQDATIVSGEAQATSEECAICSAPMEEPHEFRGNWTCTKCYELLKDL